jgi:hypothetical protein
MRIKRICGCCMIAGCLLVWEDRAPLPAPGGPLDQEVRVQVCLAQDRVTSIRVEQRILAGDEELSPWKAAAVWEAPLPPTIPTPSSP